MKMVCFRADKQIPVFRDSKLQRIDAFIAYGLYTARNLIAKYRPTRSRSYSSGIQLVAYSLHALSLYLAAAGIDWKNFNDEHMERFRDWLCEKVSKSLVNRNELSAQRTTNLRLRVVYEFFWWAQEEAHLCEKIIGGVKGFRIMSMIVEAKRDLAARPPSRDRLYPKCYRQVGEGSRTSQDQYWATDDDVEAVIAWFRCNRCPLAAERNVLLLRLVQHTGWRRAAALSLTTDMFSDERIEKAADRGDVTIQITPPTQKFAQMFRKPVSLLWCRMVNQYIHGGRSAIFASLKIPEKGRCVAIFVSVKDGTELTEAYISEEFGQAFRAIGAPLGAGIHSVKRLYGDNKADEVVASFKSRGLPLTWENLAATLKHELDHTSDYAWECYVRAVKRVRGTSVEARLQEALAGKAAEVAMLESRLMQAETMAARTEAEIRTQLETAKEEARHWRNIANARRKKPLISGS